MLLNISVSIKLLVCSELSFLIKKRKKLTINKNFKQSSNVLGNLKLRYLKIQNQGHYFDVTFFSTSIYFQPIVSVMKQIVLINITLIVK